MPRASFSHASRTLAAALLAACMTFGLAACGRPPAPATTAAAETADDPLESSNRFFYSVNAGLDRYIFRPVAVAYRDTVPSAVRRPIHNALANVSAPIVFANDVLQAKPRRAGDTFMRFLINSTAGAAGFFDVATSLGYPAHSNDAGLTFALWGVPDGPFLFLPVLGPSNFRDATGYGADIAIDPFTWVGFPGSNAFEYTRYVAGAVDARAGLIDTIDNINATALDPYATYRSLYRQRRASDLQAIRDDNRATVPAWYPQH